MRSNLYAVAVFLFAVLMLGTSGAVMVGSITLTEGIWQTVVSMVGGLFFWNLLRLEETRTARKRF